MYRVFVFPLTAFEDSIIIESEDFGTAYRSGVKEAKSWNECAPYGLKVFKDNELLYEGVSVFSAGTRVRRVSDGNEVTYGGFYHVSF